MPLRPNLPTNASVAVSLEDGRLSAPSAERNMQTITKLLQLHAPRSGKALEIASGTGQHVVAFAAALPGLIWQPTEIDVQRRVSIDAWAAPHDLPNLNPAIHLDASVPGWAAVNDGQNLILLINLLHLISEDDAHTVISESARAVSPGGRFILYGPFLRSGVATSEGDKRFDASLRAQNPEIGYKNDADIVRWMQIAGLKLLDAVAMPANNLAFVAERPH